MKMKGAVRSSGFAANTERRNFRHAVIALSLIALAAMGRAARAQDDAAADNGLAVRIGYTGGLAAGNAYSDEKSWPMLAQRVGGSTPSVARADE